MDFLPALFRTKSRRLSALRSAWERPKEKPRNIPAIAHYHEAQTARGSATLGERTATDLDIDGVFAALDRTESPIGQQVLYHRLRQGAATPDDLAGFERVVETMSRDPRVRETLQLQLQALQNAACLDLFTLTEPNVLPDTAWYRVFPLLTLVTVLAVAAIPFWHPALLILLAGTMLSIGLRVTIASWLLVVAGPFRQIAPLLTAAGKIEITGATDQNIAITVAGTGDVVINNGTAKVGRVGDAVQMTTILLGGKQALWMQQMEGAVNSLAPGSVTPLSTTFAADPGLTIKDGATHLKA